MLDRPQMRIIIELVKNMVSKKSGIAAVNGTHIYYEVFHCGHLIRP